MLVNRRSLCGISLGYSVAGNETEFIVNRMKLVKFDGVCTSTFGLPGFTRIDFDKNLIVVSKAKPKPRIKDVEEAHEAAIEANKVFDNMRELGVTSKITKSKRAEDYDIVEMPMKLGRFLKYHGVDDKIVRKNSQVLSAYCKKRAGVKLKFARTSDDIEHVYNHGPHSCMAGCSSVRAYATNDIALAYIEVDGRIVARTLVNDMDESRGYVRIYGNEELLLPLLSEMGYGNKVTLSGCSLLKLYDDDKVMLPYLDCGSHVDDEGEVLIINKFGDYSAQNTGGYLYSYTCDDCGEHVGEDEIYHVSDGDRSVCSACIDDDYVVDHDTCDYIHRNDAALIDSEQVYIHRDDAVFSGIQDIWMRTNESLFSEFLDDHIHEDDAVMAIVDICSADNSLIVDYVLYCETTQLEGDVEVWVADGGCEIVNRIYDDIVIMYEQMLEEQENEDE